MIKQWYIEIKWALILTLTSFLWLCLESIFGLHDQHIDKHAIYTNLILIPTIVIFVFALRNKKLVFYKGRITYLKAFISGVIISIMVAFFGILSQYVALTVVSPDYFINATEYVIEERNMTQEAAAAYFNLRNYLVQGAFGSLIIGVLITAIVSLFVRTKNTDKNSPPN